MGGYAWVTLATNDAYSLGALVLAHSLRRVGTKHQLALLITPGVTEMMREKLRAVFNLVQEVNVLDSKDQANLALLARPELGITFTKLHCWRLTQYEKCVFVDADTFAVRNCDELFDREELSAAPDVGWPDCFNSGVFVFKPSQDTFASITAFAASKGSFDGGDQGLLNMYFKDWAHKDISKHLPFIYNMCSTATYSYLPAFKQFGEDVRIIHFIGITKPWLQYFDTMTGIVQPPMGSAHLQPLLQLWWNIFCDNVHPQLSPAMATSTLAPIWHNFPQSQQSDQSVPHFPPVPRNPVHYDANYENYERYSDIYIEAPDFSEFKDPWENYSPRDDPFINDVRQNGSGEWSGYSSKTDYTPEPANVQQQRQQDDQSLNTYDRACNVSEIVKYDEYSSQPEQRYHSRETSCEYGAQQAEMCLINENVRQVPESRQERCHPKVSTDQHNGHREYKHVEKSDAQAQHEYYSQHERPGEDRQQHNEHSDRYKHRPERDEYRHQEHHLGQRQLYVQNDYHDVQHESERQDEQDHRHHQEHHYIQRQNQYQNHHDHHNDQHHRHNRHEHDHMEDESNHTEHHGHRQDDHRALLFTPSIVEHDERKRETMADYEESTNIERHQSHFSDSEQRCQHMNNRIDESYCQRVSQRLEHHEDDQLYGAHHQSEETHSADERTDVQRTESYPLSEPCTDLRNVATQSDPYITGDSVNAGLPGALAQMTLGQPRSAEQIALEEHMRKQSWEQGQIEYMGRDSFDNIWKKICETLSLGPQRQPTPPKEFPKTDLYTVESKDRSLDETDAPAKTAKEATGSTEQIQTCKVPTTENIVPPAQAIDKEAADALATEQDVKDESESVTEKQETEIDSKQCVVRPTQKLAKLDQIPSVAATPACQIPGAIDTASVCPLVLPAKKDDTVIEQTVIPKDEESKHVACSLNKANVIRPQLEESTKTCGPYASTDMTSPVPIQVAESVLQAEPKESVSEEPGPIKEEIVSSVEIPVQESVAALSEKPMEPMTSRATCVLRQESTTGQANGSLSADALAKLQPTDTAVSPTTICPIPLREAPSSETVRTTAEMKRVIGEVECSKTGAGGEEGSVCPLRTETAITDLSKSEVSGVLARSEALRTATASAVDEMPKCEIPKFESAIVETSSLQMPKPEVPESDVTAPAAPIADSPKCVMPVTEATSETTSIAKLSESEQTKSASTATPAPQTPKLEPLEAEALPTPITEVLECKLSATKEKQVAAAVEPLKPESPITKAPKCEIPPTTPRMTEAIETKAQEAPKPDPLKIPIPMPETPLSHSTKPTSPETPDSPSETPVRPNRTKELNIPPTPTVTEPTPPTSPPICGDPLDLESQTKTKKTTKKVMKKSASECESGDGAEGDSERKTKKSVKKVTKKSKESLMEEGAEGSSAEKPKKTVKVVKKIAKPSQTLGADPSVPETPPPGSSDAPVPPKRKMKSSTLAKKADEP